MKLETEMAKVFAPKELLRDPNATYNVRTFDEFQKLIPNFDIRAYLNTMQLGNLPEVNIGQIDYIIGLNNILGKTDINGEAIQILQKLTFEDFQSLFQNQEYQNNKSFGKIQKQLKNAMYQLIDVEHLQLSNIKK